MRLHFAERRYMKPEVFHCFFEQRLSDSVVQPLRQRTVLIEPYQFMKQGAQVPFKIVRMIGQTLPEMRFCQVEDSGNTGIIVMWPET